MLTFFLWLLGAWFLFMVGIFVTLFISLLQAIGAGIWARLPVHSVRAKFWIATAWFGIVGLYMIAIVGGAIAHGGG